MKVCVNLFHAFNEYKEEINPLKNLKLCGCR